MSEHTVIDGDGLILGRMASLVARRLLAGEIIEIVNAEKIVVSGKRKMVVDKELEFLNVGGHEKGPVHYRQPNRIVRKTIRGMLPYRKPMGKKAFSHLRVHIGVPDELAAVEKQSIPEVHSDNLSRKFVTVGEIAEAIGWKK
jgi:large subunit ribosomal protein L13